MAPFSENKMKTKNSISMREADRVAPIGLFLRKFDRDTVACRASSVIIIHIFVGIPQIPQHNSINSIQSDLKITS